MKQTKEKGAKLYVIWVNTDIEVCRQRMIERNSPRDTWKLANWQAYISQRDFSVPKLFTEPDSNGELLIFNNSSMEEFEQSLEEISNYLLKNN